ncbi:TonB-dependent copper receptor [Thiothrix unzii]|uniref:TonB-dependent copper receptor n=1 Tax=Thiothrix unzii TaxID=111769 RepID=A0A975F9P4_9GAMM|nr:TonB-dependent copper receptor [Thiothrix unzii]QTR53852.1 TonB-dependent copper receptor [Thiothrix unzii]
MQHLSVRLVLLSSMLVLSSAALADDTLVVNVKANKKATPNESKPLGTDRRPVLPADGGDFLKQLNGVSGSRFGGRGIEPIIRGQSQTQVNVLLDGAYLHGGCPNRMDPPTSYAALETYEKVTVEKGVQTLQHGSGGSGGTVLFERDTRSQIDPEDGLSGKASLTGSTNGIKHDLSVDVTKASEKGYVRVFAQDREAGHYEDGDGKEVKSAYKHKQGGIVLGATPTADRTIEYSYENNDFDDAWYPGAGMDSPVEKADIHRLKYKDKFNGKVESVDAEVYLSEVEHVMDNFSVRMPERPIADRRSVPTTSDTVGGKLALKSHVGNTDVTYGVNVQNRTRNASMKGGTGMDMYLLWPDAKTDQTGLFVEAETKLSDQGKLKYGARVDRVEASASKAGQNFAANTANTKYQKYYSGVTAQDTQGKTENNVGALLRYEHALNENTQVFTGLSRTVRTADETERYLNNGTWVGNPNIKPEKHHQLDLGISQQRGKVRWTGSLFADKVDDFILRDKAAGQAGIKTADGATIYRNVDADITGIELGASAKLTDKVTLSGDIAHVRRTNTTDNRAISQTPADNGKVQLDYNGAKWGSGARVRFASNQDRIDTLSGLDAGKTPGYGVLDAYGRYSISKNTKVRFGVDNVFDKTYAEHVSRADTINSTVNVPVRVNEAGRTTWLKLETEF